MDAGTFQVLTSTSTRPSPRQPQGILLSDKVVIGAAISMIEHYGHVYGFSSNKGISDELVDHPISLSFLEQVSESKSFCQQKLSDISKLVEPPSDCKKYCCTFFQKVIDFKNASATNSNQEAKDSTKIFLPYHEQKPVGQRKQVTFPSVFVPPKSTTPVDRGILKNVHPKSSGNHVQKVVNFFRKFCQF